MPCLLHRHSVGTLLVYSTKQCGGYTLTIWCLQDGWTPLFAAAFYGYTEVVQVLLSCRGINVNAADEVKPLDPWLVWAGVGFLVYVRLCGKTVARQPCVSCVIWCQRQLTTWPRCDQRSSLQGFWPRIAYSVAGNIAVIDIQIIDHMDHIDHIQLILSKFLCMLSGKMLNHL
jgi:Ankyrin repeats (3 copies)